MRNEYVKPVTQVEELVVESTMLTASADYEYIEIDPDQSGRADANGRRGSWGNLWN